MPRLVLTVAITGGLLRGAVRSDPARPVAAAVTFAAVVRQRAFRAALASNFVNGWTVYGVRVALVPLFVVEVLHRPGSWSGIALAAFAAGTGATLLIGGRWADDRGRRLPILVGSATVAVTSLWVGLAGGMAELVARVAGVGRRNRADEPGRERVGHRRDRRTRPRGEQRLCVGWFPDGGETSVRSSVRSRPALIVEGAGFFAAFATNGAIAVVSCTLWLRVVDTRRCSDEQ